MITPELLKDPDYRLALRFADIARKSGNERRAWWIEQEAQTSELAIALYDSMLFLVEKSIPVSYDDWKDLGSWFSHEDDDPDLYPKHYYRVADDEAEVFKKLKIADE